LNNLPSSRGETLRPTGAPRSGALHSSPARAALPVFRRLNVSWWFTPLLTAATLLSATALVLVAYFGAQTNALASAQARNGQSAQAASALLTSNGADLTVDANGELVASGNGVTVIPARNGATANRLQALFGEGIAIYQYRNGGLTIISTSPNVVSAQGAVLSDAASAELLGQCAKSKVNCHQQYMGETQAHGVTYVAGFSPLFDPSGAFVGVVAVLTPLAVVMQPPMQLLVTLSLVGLLVTLAALAAGLWLFGSLAGRRLDEVRARLGALGVVAANVEETVYGHAVRARRQERMGRQLADEAYQLDALASALEQGYAALQDEVNDVWAGASQPGVSYPGETDGQSMLRMARQTVVAAARLGADAEDATSLSRQMGPLLNTLIAEDHALAESAQATERLAGDLRAALDQVEMALGSRLAPRPQNALSGLLARARQVSQRLKRQADPTGPAHSTNPAKASGAPRRPTPQANDVTGGHASGAPRRGDTGVYGARRPSAGAGRPSAGMGASGANRPQTGQHPAAPQRPSGGMGRMPAPQTPPSSQPQRPPHSQGGSWSEGPGAAKGATSGQWRTPTGEQPAAPWSTSGEYQSPWLNDLPGAPNNPNASGRQHPSHPNTPSHPGRDPRATDTGWLND